MENQYIAEFVTGALKYASDDYRNSPSPLLADAYHKDTKKHLRRDYGSRPDCRDVVYSNLARQMNFMRVLNALYILGGNMEYQKILRENYEFYIRHFQSENGLFFWGGHMLVDLKSLNAVGEGVHELKNDYPAYPLMFEIDRENTKRYIEGFWNAHVFNWERLEISRHGNYAREIGALWENDFADPEPFIEVRGLSFINAGSDLIYAACEYYKAIGEEKALLWAKRLEHMYYKARDKNTGLGVYQFNQPKARKQTDDFSNTMSAYGDRAKRQMGPELGETCLEGNVLTGEKTRNIYGHAMVVFLHVAQSFAASKGSAGEFSQTLLDHCREGLEAFAKHAYIPEKNMFRPLLANGTDLTDFELQRDGYYGKKGRILRKYPADGMHFLVFAKCAALTRSELLLETAANIARAMGFGDIGKLGEEKPALNFGTDSVCPFCLFAFLNLHVVTKNKEFLEMAEAIARNITDGKAFANSNEYVMLNNLHPLAVVCVEAAKQGRLGDINSSVYI